MVKYTDQVVFRDVPETKERARIIAGQFGDVAKVLRLAVSLGLNILEQNAKNKEKHNG